MYERYGAQRYDEELSQLAHAEQTAALAVAAGADDEVVAAFEGNAGWEGAVELRRWDDAAKVLDLDVPPIGSYRPLLERLSR